MGQVRTNMSIETFVKVAVAMAPTTSVLLRGDHGIGKSQVVREVARRRAEIDGIQRKVIDRRLAQMTEGDMLGLPSTDGNVTRWNPMEWFKEACDSPCVLLLDELNRANTEIMQAAFQIVLDRELDGRKLHKDTLVYAAVNTSAAYTVNEIDPALLDRFFVVDLNPSVQDWLNWANSKGDDGQPMIEPIIVDFIRSKESWLDTPKDIEPQTVAPSRRSWERVSNELRRVGVVDDPDDPLFYPLCLGHIGTEASIALNSFAKNYDRQVTAEELLESYTSKKVQKKLKGPNLDRDVTQEQFNTCLEKLADHVTEKLERLTAKQGKNIAAFMTDLPHELRVNFWSKMVKHGVDKIDLSKDVHKYCGALILEIFGVLPGEAGIGMVPNIPGMFKQEGDKS